MCVCVVCVCCVGDVAILEEGLHESAGCLSEKGGGAPLDLRAGRTVYAVSPRLGQSRCVVGGLSNFRCVLWGGGGGHHIIEEGLHGSAGQLACGLAGHLII